MAYINGKNITFISDVNIIEENTEKYNQFIDRSITEITAEDLSGITSIAEYAFTMCSNLVSVVIPNNIKSIGKYAICDCNNLTTITLLATTPPTLGSYAIPSNVTTLYIPAGTLSAYQSATNWNSFADKFVELS